MEIDVTGLARGGTRYSSTSSLSSAATASSPQALQSTSATSSIHNQVATAAVVCQAQGMNLAPSSRESPPASSSPGTPAPSIPTPAQVRSIRDRRQYRAQKFYGRLNWLGRLSPRLLIRTSLDRIPVSAKIVTNRFYSFQNG